ncbi:MAG: hypothetical protein ACOYKE_00145 [Ferruginibacter sp.]
MKQYLTALLCTFLLNQTLNAQECFVGVEALKGTYSGDCKKGKANGIGTAIGIDTFIGHFKNGYPNGQGKYTWKNGDVYEGSWKNGVFEGYGIFIQQSTPDSITKFAGYWEKGKYKGDFEHPYMVSFLTNNFSDFNIRKQDELKSQISFTIKNSTAGGSAIDNPVLPKCMLTDIQIITGNFEDKLTDTSTHIASRYILRKVIFPFTAILTFEIVGKKISVERAKLEINEKGNWLIYVNIEN